MIVRYAVRDDFEQVLKLTIDLHKEQAVFSLDFDRAAQCVVRSIEAGECLVAIRDGRVIGTFGLTVWTPDYSRDSVLTDTWIYVAPDHRRSTAILRLKRAAKAHARKAGFPFITGAVGNGLRAARLFENDPDFRKIGDLYLMR